MIIVQAQCSLNALVRPRNSLYVFEEEFRNMQEKCFLKVLSELQILIEGLLAKHLAQ